MSGKKIYKKFVLELVKKRCPSKKQTKYSNGYYFDRMILLLRNVVSWRSLGVIYKKTKTYHYKTIAAKFREWSNLNIFEDAYYEGIKTIINTFDCHSTIDLFIDTSSMNNKYGEESVAYGQNKKKKISKVSIICNSEKIPLSITMHKGSVHDVKTVEKSVEKLKDKIKYRAINMIADKGYAGKEIAGKLSEMKIKMITPCKKNQKVNTCKPDCLPRCRKTECLANKKKAALKKNTKKELQKLKIRYVVEHANQSMKDCNRISIRRDRKDINFMSFIFMAFGEKYSI